MATKGAHLIGSLATRHTHAHICPLIWKPAPLWLRQRDEFRSQKTVSYRRSILHLEMPYPREWNWEDQLERLNINYVWKKTEDKTIFRVMHLRRSSMGGTSYLEKELTKGRRVVPRNERKYITQGPKGRACGIEWKGGGEPGQHFRTWKWISLVVGAEQQMCQEALPERKMKSIKKRRLYLDSIIKKPIMHREGSSIWRPTWRVRCSDYRAVIPACM